MSASMEDRELLILAADAAGLNWRDWTKVIHEDEFELGLWPYDWNPLESDGDALGLAAKVLPRLEFGDGFVDAFTRVDYSGRSACCEAYAMHGGDVMAATRRAIVRAAAQIGAGMKKGTA